VKSGQTSEPEWEETPEGFLDVTRYNGEAVKCLVRQVGGTREPSLQLNLVAMRGAHGPEYEAVEGIRRLLRLDDDLERIYHHLTVIGDAEVNATVHRFAGLRLMHSRDPFVGLICSIWSQNNSVRLWNRSVRIMRNHFGERIRFRDGSAYRLFPSARRLSKVNVQHFKAVTRCGYRAKYILQAARLVHRGDLDLNAVDKMSYLPAREVMIEVVGIGPKVADCFLLYGLGKTDAAPVDVWVHRVAKRLFFQHGKVTRERVARFLRERYGNLAGYAQLYLFCLARETALTGALDR
jgi:N-glycosylase/DNA lyase